MVREISEPTVPRPQHTLFRFRFAVIGALVLALPLAACGRKGALDPPPGGYVLEDIPSRVTPVTRRGAPPQQQEKQAEFDDEGRPVAPKGLKKKLPGDWLID
jgi:predicted small lipoprotein YifL